MAISIVETAGSATANSYVTLAQAQAFIDGLVENEDVTAWSSATTDQKTAHFLVLHKELIGKDF